MTTPAVDGRQKQDEGGGTDLPCDNHCAHRVYQYHPSNKTSSNMNTSSQLNVRVDDDQHNASHHINHHHDDSDAQAVAIFAKHLDQQQFSEQQQRERRSSLPTDAIELTTLSGVVMRRKQELQLRSYQDQQSNKIINCNHHNHKHHLLAPTVSSAPAPKTARPLSISSISSAASSGSSSSANSSSSSGIQSSLTRNGSLNYGHEFRKHAYLASVESLNNPQSSAKLTSLTQVPDTVSVVDSALKNLHLSGQFKDAAARAAVLAAGESQRRNAAGSSPGWRVSRINRSLHASLRYDKTTAHRIHLMANERALLNSGNNSASKQGSSDAAGDECCSTRCSSSISRNNSSTSTDSGHHRQGEVVRGAGVGSPARFSCQCSLATTATVSITSSSSASRVDGHHQTSDLTEKDSIASVVFSNKAATLDGASCQRTSNAANMRPQHHHPECSYAIQSRRHMSKLQPSPSSASSHSNTSSLFRDDGFEDDLTSAASTSSSSYLRNQHHRLSFHYQQSSHLYRNQHGDLLRTSQQHEEDDDYQSCEEEFSNSHTTASTTSNLDDCALSTTSSSIIHNHRHEHNQVLDKISLATAKQQYRKSLLLEHQQQQHLHALHASNQNKIQALLQSPPKLCHLPTVASQNVASQSAAGNNVSGVVSSKQAKSDDRTVNIIGHMPTRNPGYWDSNLSITQRVVTEIIETERTYVDDLEQIVTGYICYLRNVLKQQQKHLAQQNHQQAFHRQLAANAEMVRTTADDDDKSIVVFDDEIANEAEDYDVDDNDVVMKDHALIDCRGEQVKRSAKVSTVASSTDAAIISSIDIKKLFNNLEDIYKFNKDLLFRLEECYLNPSSVAECFVENSAGFEVYTHYCTMYPQVVSTLTELMADPCAAQLLKERQNELNQSLPLGAYLLKPVQRILKYHILFQSLIKHTADDDSVSEKDRQLINEAFSVMTSIACHINAMKKRHEHSIRVQEVQGLLSGWQGPDLTTLGELILEDTFRLCNRQKSCRHLFLFDNVLLITKKKRDGSLCYKGHIECSNLMLIENIERQPLVFHTVPFDNPKALYAFQAKNLDKKRDWCLQMKEVIIKSFEVKIPVHVRDILMSLTNTGAQETNFKPSATDSARSVRAPNYLEKKRIRQDKKKSL